MAKRRTPRTHRRCALALATLLAVLPPAGATIFRPPPAYWTAVEIVPANGGSNELFVHALNDQGRVVGSFNYLNGERGFIWYGQAGQAPQPLPLSDAWGLASDGSVLGVALGSSLQRLGYGSLTGREYAVKMLPNGAIQVLTPTATTGDTFDTFGMAFAANAAGTVVGVSTDEAGRYGSAIWNGDNNSPSFIDISLGSRPGSFLSGRMGLAINDAGTVVGGRTRLETWSLAEGRRDLGGLPGATSSRGTDVNNTGLMVGMSFFGTSSTRGFLYNSATGSFTTLTGIGGTGDSVAWSVNDHGDAVGMSGLPGYVYSRAVWWKPDGEVVDLNQLTFTNLSGVRLQSAIDINNRGQILVSGMRVDAAGEITNAGLRHWVLSQCERCGQIAPYPNPAGTTLDVGPDWYAAVNDVPFENNGRLVIGTTLNNYSAGRIDNSSFVDILGTGGKLVNDGVLATQIDGVTTVYGELQNQRHGLVQTDGLLDVRRGARLFNTGLVAVRPQGTMWVAGSVENNDGRFWVIDGGFLLARGADFVNWNGASFMLAGGRAELLGNMQFKPNTTLELSAVNGVLAEMTVSDGSSLQLEGATLKLSNASTLTVSGERSDLDANASSVFISEGSRLTLQSGAWFRQHNGGTLLIAGNSLSGPSELRVEPTAVAELRGSTTVGGELGQHGKLVVDRGSLWVHGDMTVTYNGVIDISGTDGALVIFDGGNITTNGKILLDSDAEVDIRGGQLKIINTGSLISQGRVRMVSGALTVDRYNTLNAGHSFYQYDGVSTINGNLHAQQMRFQSGVLRGSGRLTGEVFVISNGVQRDPRLQIGNSPGTLTIDGDLTLDGASFELELGPQAQDQLVVTGQLDLGRLQVDVVPWGGYTPDLDDSVSFLTAASIVSVAAPLQLTIDTSALGSGWQPQLTLGPAGLRTTLDRADAFELADVAEGSLMQVGAADWAYSRYLRVDGRLDIAGRMTHRAGLLDLYTGAVVDEGLLQIGPNGTLAVLPGGSFSSRSVMQNQGLIQNSGQWHHRAGASLDSTGRLQNDGLLRNDGLITLSRGTAVNTGQWEEHGRLEVGATAVFQNTATGQVVVGGRFVNQGLVTSAGRLHVQDGATLTGAPDAADDPTAAGIYQQYGSVTALTRVDGVLAQARIDIFDGVLEGHGKLAGAITLGSSSLRPGSADVPGRLTFEGAVQMTGTQIELLAGPDGHASLAVTGSLDLGSGAQLWLKFLPGYAPAAGVSLELLTIDGTLSGAAQLSTNAAYLDATGGLYLWAPPAGMTAGFHWEGQSLVFQTAAVPEPHGWALLLGGLVAIGAVKRRASRR